MDLHKLLVTPLYFGQDDFLRLGVQNTVASVTVTFAGQFLVDGGDVIPFSFAVVPATDRSETVQRNLLGPGWLLHLTAVVTAGTVRRGQCLVSAQAQRGDGANGLITTRLLSGYATADYSPSWPISPPERGLDGAGILRSIAGTNPAAGAECSDTVPTGARWQLLSWRVQLVTAIAAATRQVHLVIDDGTTILQDLPASATQIASLTRNYNASALGFSQGLIDSELYIPIHPTIRLFAGYRIRTVTTAIQGADDYGAPQIAVQEWLEL